MKVNYLKNQQNKVKPSSVTNKTTVGPMYAKDDE